MAKRKFNGFLTFILCVVFFCAGFIGGGYGFLYLKSQDEISHINVYTAGNIEHTTNDLYTNGVDKYYRFGSLTNPSDFTYVTSEEITNAVNVLKEKGALPENFDINNDIYISKLDSNTEREIYLKVLSKRVFISVDVLRRDLSGSKLTKPSNPLKAEATPEKPFVVRQEGNTKATKFIIASIIHKQPYAVEDVRKNFKFKNSSYQNLYDFVVKCESEGKTYTISSLFDYFDVDNNPDIKEIIESLNTITGENATEDIINEIFKKFCLGK